MKKTVTLLLASALFLFTLTGCMKASENNTDPFATQTSESTATTASSPYSHSRPCSGTRRTKKQLATATGISWIDLLFGYERKETEVY